MSADKNSMFTAAVIVCGAIAASLGMVVRDRVDLPIRGSGLLSEIPGTRMASAQDPKEGIDIPEREYFEQMVEMLKQGYVEPITDDQKLVSGAVRGMVGSLEDANAVYMDAEEFRVFQNAREGAYEGIGVDLAFALPPKSTDPNDQGVRIPRLMVAAVAPGGPAEKAGVLPGDIVESVDGRWVVNLQLLADFRKLQRLVDQKKESPEKLIKTRNELRAKSDHGLLPSKAKDKLIVGQSGQIKVTWERGTELRETTLVKAPSRSTPVTGSGADLKVRLMPGVGSALTSQLPAEGTVTLDLRNNAFSDLTTINEALAALLPKGTVGKLVNGRGGSVPLLVAKGRAKPLQYRVIVDGSTHTGAALVAQALKAQGAKVEGTPAADQQAIEVVRLPDGSGFTLPKGFFKEGSK